MSTADPELIGSSEPQDLANLLDCLIPGDGERWPRFSDAVNVAVFVEALPSAARETALLWAQALWPLAPEARVSFLKRCESEQPAAFAALLGAMRRAYYSAPLTLDAVRALAESGPREASDRFDPALVASVLAREAGRRRL